MVKELTGAKLMAMQEDVPALLKITPGNKPHVVDRILHDGDEVTSGRHDAGGASDPGHTRGCTTWTTKIADGGQVLQCRDHRQHGSEPRLSAGE